MIKIAGTVALVPHLYMKELLKQTNNLSKSTQLRDIYRAYQLTKKLPKEKLDQLLAYNDLRS